ncbi:MAG: hydantoinase B/oxoprolinase family protein [Anaerolineales bacterium]|nr:hydantoinase B/oxoprolinase family protein [Anaerolineales bacterium]MCS7248608.1 hydantoinase B/oxoprolinase family protein [Anaerolineales bacterium]MDW8162421.1 hydantoinase B/oxoprolinase family protein [Anaerolineales bacterium]MDW8446279.1 hydantoinase B/oxoprolinase family protein [Anaerolineales bacterium]
MTARYDPITFEIIQNSLQAAADEMFAALRHTAMSAIIYEVLDMGTGITDREGELAGSGAGIPAFVGVLDKTVKRVIEKYGPSNEIEPGDIFITNDPYTGGVTHLNDVILTMPVFYNGEIVAWTANIAHWNDVGGMVPGSMSTNATEIFQEGIILSAVKLFSRGQPIRSVFDILTSNCRMPDFLTGDLWAQVASVRVGERRVLEIVNKYGKDVFLQAVKDYLDYGEQVSLDAIRRLPKGVYELVEPQDNGPDYVVKIEITDNEFIIDLTGNPDQDKGPFNMSRDEAITACQIAFKGITSPERIANGGTFRPLKVLTRKGSVFDPIYPAAMGIYYEITIRLHDLIVRCLAEKIPELLPAGGFASVCGTLFGGIHPDTGRPYAVIEPELGGWGGSPTKDGNSGQFSALHGETYNCPAEVAEARYGVTVDYLSFHDEEGGAGYHRGGKGVRIDYRIRSDNAWLTVAYTRSKVLPWPLLGGEPGSPNHVIIERANGEKERYSVVSGLTLNTNDIIRVMTGTGAGWGNPLERPVEKVVEDVRNEYITPAIAEKSYGVIIDPETFEVLGFTNGRKQ